MKSGFLDRLVNRLDRLDPESLQNQFLKLVRERGLLETIFQSIQEGMIVIDGETRIRYANRAAERMIGFSFDAANGRPLARYLREIDWDSLLDTDGAEWSRLIRQEIEITYPEHRFLSFYLVPLPSESPADKALMMILRDVTQEHAKETTVVESERLDAIKLLAAGVAHEIGNPLNALHIHLQLLERELGASGAPEKPDLLELVGTARSEVARLDLIITQFLKAIRPTRPNLEETRVEQLLEEMLGLLKMEIQQRGMAVAVEVNDPPPAVRVDRNQMKQAFFNLARNALQAMKDGGRLTIAISTTSKHLRVAFRDTGGGIRAEELPKIFEPYYTTKAEGTGLGLMIVQRIVQDHGGRLEVASRPGEGSVFTIEVPLAEPRVRLLESGTAAAEPT